MQQKCFRPIWIGKEKLLFKRILFLLKFIFIINSAHGFENPGNCFFRLRKLQKNSRNLVYRTFFRDLLMRTLAMIFKSLTGKEKFLFITSLDKRPPVFQNSSKNYFTSISSDYGLGTGNPRNLVVQAIFAIFRILFFFKITSSSVFFCSENFNF